MQQSKLTTIRYKKFVEESDTLQIAEKSERVIVPAIIPGNIKAIDVTDLNDGEQQEMCDLYEEYSEYFNNHQKRAYSFEDWASHTMQRDISPKWRTFKPDQTEEIA